MANPWLPRWSDPAVRYDRGWTYPTAAEIQAARNQPTKKGSMKRQAYYPSRIADQVPWLVNFYTKLPGYETALSLPSVQVDACVASCQYAVYVLEQWLTAVREFGPAATSAVDLLLSGTGSSAVVLPGFAAPALPSGVASVPPGALNRVFALVQLNKLNAAYTETIGQDLGIIGAAGQAVQGAPEFKCQVIDAVAGGKAVRIPFVKHSHQGVHLECKRGTGDFEFVAVDTETPYLDERPLLVAGTPEQRQYRMRFWDKGTPNGDWSDITTVTVGV